MKTNNTKMDREELKLKTFKDLRDSSKRYWFGDDSDLIMSAGERLLDFVNENKIIIKSITTTGRWNEVYVLFYEEELKNG